MNNTLDLVSYGPVIPVIVLQRVEDAVPLAEALVAGGVRVGDGRDDAGAERLVLEQHRAVDVEHDEKALGGRGGVGCLGGELFDQLGRDGLQGDLDRARLGQVRRGVVGHSTGSSTSRPPR